MSVYARLLFDASDDNDDTIPTAITVKFKNMDQFNDMNDNYRYDEIIGDINNILPAGQFVDSEIELDTVSYIAPQVIDLSIS